MGHKITLQDVAQAAAECNMPLLEAISLMQSTADDEMLEQLCTIKHAILFGEDE